MNNTKIALAAICIFSSLQGYAAGYEKTVMWSAKWAGLGGAAAGAVEGADAIFYNPAGLVDGANSEVSLNYSPLLTKTTGAQTATDEELESEKKVKHIFGVTGKHQLNNKFAFGVGTYVSGGAGSSYKEVDYSGVQAGFAGFKPDVESSVQLLEIGLGGAYKVTPNWNVGATYRISVAKAKFSSVSLASSDMLLINTRFDDLGDTNFEGFRLGTQYTADDKSWGLGASYRSEIALTLEGDASGQTINAGGAQTNLTGGKNSKLKSVFPQQLNAGGFYKITERDTIFGEYSWTDYSRNSEIKIEGELLYSGVSNVLENGTVKQNWHDAHAAKLGYEHQFDTWALRGGYAYTSQVTDDKAVSITFSAPSYGHTATLGAGTALLANSLHLDFAAEWSKISGTGSRANLLTPVSGEYTSTAYGLHTSVRYTF